MCFNDLFAHFKTIYHICFIINFQHFLDLLVFYKKYSYVLTCCFLLVFFELLYTFNLIISLFFWYLFDKCLKL
jgi:hypothetical protein